MAHAACETSNTSNANNADSLASSRVESPMKQLKFYLDKYKIKDALQIFFNESTLRLLAEEPDFMWDVIPLICKRLRGLCQYRFRVFEGCERMLYRLAEDEHCNPKEVLISLLAEINQTEHREDDNVFRAMIRPLEGALLRMSLPSPREENFRWTINVLMRHINETPLPQEYNIEGQKRLSLPNDPSVKRFIETLPLMVSFIEELNEKPIDYDKSPMPILTESQIDEVLNGELVDDDDFISEDHAPLRCDITDASITALLRLLQRPLTCLDTTYYCKELRSTGVRGLALLLRLMPDLLAPIYKQSKAGVYGSYDQPSSKLDESSSLDIAADIIESNISSLAANHFDGSISDAMLTLATCAYLYRCEVKACAYQSPQSSPYELTPPQSSAAAISNLVTQPFIMTTTPQAMDMTQFFPQILTHESLLYCHIPFIVALLKRPEILAHEKGLILLGNLLALLRLNSQGEKLLELTKSTLGPPLFQIMIHSPLNTNRRWAYELFTVICDLLTYDCKLDIFMWVIQGEELRPCIRAACIDQYRRHLAIIQKELTRPRQEVELDMWIARHRILWGQNLISFLDMCIAACLPENQHTDIIENNDLVLATLTILRYLGLRKTPFQDAIEKEYLTSKNLKKRFFDPVRTAIALVKNELKGHLREKVHPDQSADVECLNFVLCRVDLVESVLVTTCDQFDVKSSSARSSETKKTKG